MTAAASLFIGAGCSSEKKPEPPKKVQAEEKLKLLASAAEKGKKELEAKINEAKKKREENKEENKDGEENKPSE